MSKVMAKTYQDYYLIASDILGKKSNLNKKDYDKFMAIPYDEFKDFEKLEFDMLYEGLSIRISEVVADVGNANFLD
tara:strand:+ start:64 stop:291 length:228 start_codon:yes stop_codon:yes gene_type:complete